MQQREKILLAVVASLLVVLGGRVAWNQYADALDRRQKQLEALKLEAARQQARQDDGHDAAKQLAEWEQRSLPADAELARTLYQNWLTMEADRAGLKSISVEPGRGATKKDAYQALVFTIRAKGSLELAVRWLHSFYSADYLHLLREARIEPLPGGRDLDLQFTVEALSLPGANSTSLPKLPERKLALGDAKAYAKVILGRNFFAPYNPPPPPPQPTVRRDPPKPPPFDPSKFAVLTAVVRVGDARQAWINVRPTGELLKLAEGDQFDVGPFRGRVKRIGLDEVEIETEDGMRILSLGAPLTPSSASS